MKVNKRLYKLYKTGIILFCIFASLLGIVYYVAVNKNKNLTYPRAVKGTIDLTNIEMPDTTGIRLSGEWEFYYRHFLNPSAKNNVKPDGYIEAGNWNNFIYKGIKVGGDGYATYRLMILGLSPGTIYGIEIPDMACAYRLYIDEKLISENGTPGKNAQEEIPLWKPTISSFTPHSKATEVVVHVSNFHHVEGGMWERIIIGKPEQILNNNNINILKSFFLIGAILLLGLHHSVLYIFIKDNKSALNLFLFCINSAIRELTTGKTIVPIQIIVPSIPFFITMRLEFITIPLAMIFYGNFINTLFPDLFMKRIYSFLKILNFIYVLIILTTSLKTFRGLLWYGELVLALTVLYILYVFALATKKRIYGSGLVLLATIILIIVTLMDALVIGPTYLQGIGVLLFILILSYLSNLKITNVFEEAERKAAIEISFFQAQIVPHFLYNILNTLHYFISTDSNKAKEILLEIGNYLRGKFRILKYDQHRLIELHEEMSMIDSYLKLENIRLGNRLNIDIDLEEASLDVKIPPLILQPIVENAIIHGVDTRSKNPKIAICARFTDEELVISVEDNGKGISPNLLSQISNGKSESIGLQNVINRLKLYYNSKLVINSKEGEGTSVTISIPIK